MENYFTWRIEEHGSCFVKWTFFDNPISKTMPKTLVSNFTEYKKECDTDYIGF